MKLTILSAEERFDILVEALKNTDNQSADTFRENLLKAYNCENGVALGKWSSTEAAEIEKEFAERCLAGIGPDENEATLDMENLCTVLTKEIGTQKEDHKLIPWLGGDWVKMARLIIHNAEIQLAGADDPRPPNRTEEIWRIIRVWPIKDTVGDPRALPMQRTNRICYRIGNSTSGIQKIWVQARSALKVQDYQWVILAEPPGELGRIANEETGLARNLWKGLEWDPGDEQER